MQPPKPQIGQFLDDMSKVFGSAVGVAAGFREQGRDTLRDKGSEVAHKLDIATFEEFRALKAQVNAQQAKIEALEAELTSLKKKPAAKKPAAKKTTKK